MGGDGGTKSLQRKFIRSAQDKQSWKGWGVGGPGGVTSQAELARVRVSQCALTQKPLVQPIAADRLGNLFNKDDLVLALQAKAVEGAPLPSAFKHIRGLGDVTTLRLTPNPAASSGATKPGSSLAAALSSSPASASSSSFSSGSATSRAAAVAAAAKTMQDLRMGGGADRPAPFMCPVTRLELNGRNRFVVVFQGGGEGPVLAERCLKRMSPTDLEADVGRAFAKEECVLLTPGEEEYAVMRRALAAEFKAAKARKKADKAAKKRKQLTAAVAAGGGGGSAAGVAGGGSGSGSGSAAPPAHHPSKRKADGSEDAVGAPAPVGDAGQAEGAVVVAAAREGDSNNDDGGGGGEGGDRKKSKLSKQERRRAKEAKKAARQRQRQQNGAVATSLAYAGIGEEAEARAAKLKESNKTFASLFAREPTKSEREQQANLFIRVAGRMY